MATKRSGKPSLTAAKAAQLIGFGLLLACPVALAAVLKAVFGPIALAALSAFALCVLTGDRPFGRK